MANDGGSAARVGSILRENREALLARWVGRVEAALGGRTTTQEVEAELGPILDAIVHALESGSGTRQEGFAQARVMLVELARERARQGFSPTESASTLLGLKYAASRLLDDEGDELLLSSVADDLAMVTFESYVAARETVITELAEQLLELSTPVIKLWDGVVAVPLVGTLDSARTQVVMEKLLQTLVDTGCDHAIIDITGVPAVDTQVAQHLLKTVVAARLMGAECVISGIRPQIAQTIVALGIEFGDIATKATLADALKLAISGRVGE